MLSEKLANFIVQTKYEDLPADVVAFTKDCILDWLGSAIAGASKPPVRMMHEFAVEQGGLPQATLITGGKTSVVQASFVNGGASHIVEQDDIHKASIVHAATVVIPAALAIAEWKKKSGRDFIAAVAIGYDVCFRVGEAVSPSHYYYWHNTATCGTFGAVAAAAKLLDLNTEQIVHALGNAGTQAAGLWEFITDGANSKQLHTGKAAMNGVLAALLAEKGFTGPRKILEGERGFFKAMSTAYDESKITNRLGEVYKIVENSFKIHASCRHTHQAVDMILDLRENEGIQPQDVDSVSVGIYASGIQVAGNPDPKTVYAAKFSNEFCTALALYRGSAGLNDFTESTLWNEDIRALMSKMYVYVDAEMEQAYPDKWAAKMTVKLKDGRELTRSLNYPKGDPENPVTTEELVLKFKQLASDLPPESLQAHVDQVLHLETLADVSTWFDEEGGRV